MPHVIRTDSLVIVDAAGTGLGVPAGTTAQRPTNPPVGTIRYNTDGPYLELWDGGAWNVVGAGGGGGSFVQKSGDTMTGDLVFTDFARILAANSASATVPSYTFRDSTDSGLGRLSSGPVFLAVSGTSYIWIDSAADTLTLATTATGPLLHLDPSGRVGIGTTSPSCELDVSGTGAIRIPSGPQAARPAPQQGMLRFDTDNAVLEYFDGVSWQTVVSSATSGTVTSVDVQPGTAGLSTSGGPITTSGTITVSLADDVLALESLTGTGFAVRTAADTWTTRSLTSNVTNIIITNPDGAAGAPYFDLAATGVTAGTYTLITVDSYGRVTAAAQASISDLAAPTGDVDWGGWRITNLANPVDPQDAATRAYVDGTLASFSIDAKDAVRLATAAAADLLGFTYDPGTDSWSTPATFSFDGVTPTDGDRLLVKDASDQRGNGIWVYDAGTTSLIRAPDADNSPGSEFGGGARTYVIEGTVNAGTVWYVSSPLGIANLGVDNIIIQRVAAGVTQVDTGTGLTGGPIINTGTISLDGQALEFHQLATDGFVVRSGAPPGNVLTRTITGAAGQIAVTDGDGIAGDPLIAIEANPTIPGVQAITIPAGATTDRPTTPVVGMIRINTSASPPRLELWDGTTWIGVVDENYDSDFVLRAGDIMAGTLGVLEGSETAPGLTFASDPNTGLFSNAVGDFGITAQQQEVFYADSATGRLRLSAPGNTTPALTVDGGTSTVGIFGTPAGTWTLEVFGDARVQTDLQVDGYVARSVETGITSTGSDLATAYQLTKVVSEVTAVPANTGVRLDPNTPIGADVIIINAGANDLRVYPPTTTVSINQQSPGTPLVLTAGTVGRLVRTSATLFYAW